MTDAVSLAEARDVLCEIDAIGCEIARLEAAFGADHEQLMAVRQWQRQMRCRVVETIECLWVRTTSHDHAGGTVH